VLQPNIGREGGRKEGGGEGGEGLSYTLIHIFFFFLKAITSQEEGE
jgi:hypothetical protein